MTGPTLVELPVTYAANIPEKLRKLAAQIEAGEFDNANSLAWVMDCGNNRVEIGLMGQAEFPGVEAHFLFSLAASKIIAGVLNAD